MKSSLFFIVIALSIALASCGNEPERETGPDMPLEVETPKVAEVHDIVYGVDKLTTAPEHEGKIVNAVTWKDSHDHLIMLTIGEYVQEHPAEGEDDYALPLATQYLYGYHYIMDGGTGEPELLWSVQDFVKDCEFDLVMEFVEGTLEVTDLDRDGEAESLFIYRMTCTSDVSPMTQKLLMHEGENKYAIRGTTDLEMMPGEIEEGETNLDPAFDVEGVPGSFRIHAQKVWNANKTISMGL